MISSTWQCKGAIVSKSLRCKLLKALLAQLYWEYRFELRETTKTNGGYRPFSVV